MRRTVALVLLHAMIFFLSSAAQADTAQGRIGDYEVPAIALNVNDFVPPDWTIEVEIKQDINGDGKLDRVLVLLENRRNLAPGDKPIPRARVLTVLLKMRKPGFRRVGLATRLLHCSGCSDGVETGTEGVKPQIRIAKRELIVEETWSNGKTVNMRLHFRHDARSGRVQLIGEDIQAIDRSSGARRRIKSNFLEGTRVIENGQFDLAKRQFIKVNKASRKIPKTFRHIEEIDYRDYERLAEQQTPAVR